jgi:hypothetical protein
VIEQQIENLTALQRISTDADNGILAADRPERMSYSRRLATAHGTGDADDAIVSGDSLLDAGHEFRHLWSDKDIRS